MSVEMVVLAPVLVIVTLFIVFLGRAGGSVQQVRHAADVAARAASLSNTINMQSVATSVATQDLADNGVNCSSTSISVALNGGGDAASVTVSVSCVVNVAGLSLLGVPARTVNAHSTEIIDRYRGS